ncbi:uncharacterized protein LOC113304259 isoform X2 [Papaver somniferum]|uniref:uncharacterized protein LOC113304259 isoform X2 n=1 Tax=Papaver somniferum TaxID=3469 RepID=UPI000E704E36|nr:uncharacterized protein LOC113304259 isoform X2 [Papaver somniferum]
MTPETPETAAKPKAAPKLVKLDRARKLAESWVYNMSGSPDGESIEEKEPEARPARLGLGARAAPQTRLGPSSDPAGKSLHNKLEASKKRATAKSLEEESNANNGQPSDDDDDEEPESRTNAFTKKIVVPAVPQSSQGKKKRRR